MQFARQFHLSEAVGRGVRCEESGLYVGATPLLERKASPSGRSGWRPRPLADLDRDLGVIYRKRVTFARKLSGLTTIASALDRGEIARAQIAAAPLGLPDPVEASALKSIPDQARILTSELKRAGILAALVGKDERESSQMEKFNPYHDEGGRFTGAAGAVAASGADATVGAHGSVVAGAILTNRPSQRRASRRSHGLPVWMRSGHASRTPFSSAEDRLRAARRPWRHASRPASRRFFRLEFRVNGRGPT